MLASHRSFRFDLQQFYERAAVVSEMSKRRPPPCAATLSRPQAANVSAIDLKADSSRTLRGARKVPKPEVRLPHSTTLSALASRVAGSERPNAFADFKLITNSKLGWLFTSNSADAFDPGLMQTEGAIVKTRRSKGSKLDADEGSNLRAD
jgi:hypothetical protein